MLSMPGVSYRCYAGVRYVLDVCHAGVIKVCYAGVLYTYVSSICGIRVSGVPNRRVIEMLGELWRWVPGVSTQITVLS